jgi:hypothetical protein
VQREAAARLGISERTLHRWRTAGLLQPGEHYRRKFPNPNSPLLYHLERCEQTMSEAAARHPGRLEVAPLSSRQGRRQPMEVAPVAGSGALRSVCFPPTPHGSPQCQPREDAEPLADGCIHAAAGPAADDLRGIKGHRPRARLRRARLAG